MSTAAEGPVATTRRGVHMSTAVPEDGRSDFDFIVGRRRVHNRKPLDVTGPERQERTGFDATAEAEPVLGGPGNVDRIRTDTFEGLILRQFDPESGVWRIWWASSARPGHPDPPVEGVFRDGRCPFFCWRPRSGTAARCVSPVDLACPAAGAPGYGRGQRLDRRPRLVACLPGLGAGRRAPSGRNGSGTSTMNESAPPRSGFSRVGVSGRARGLCVSRPLRSPAEIVPADPCFSWMSAPFGVIGESLHDSLGGNQARPCRRGRGKKSRMGRSKPTSDRTMNTT